MVSRVPTVLLRHRIRIEPYLADSAYGPQYGPAVEGIPALVDTSPRMVRAPDWRRSPPRRRSSPPRPRLSARLARHAPRRPDHDRAHRGPPHRPRAPGTGLYGGELRVSRHPRARVRWNGEQVLGRAQAGAVCGLLLGAEHVLAESRKEAPIAEGTLERSGATTIDEQDLVASVTYVTPYAARVHEDLAAWNSPGRKAKFLEDPANREAAVIGELIAAQVRRVLR